VTYKPDYTREFLDDLKRYASLKKLAWKNIRQILEDPYATSEPLTRKKTDLRGKRSQRVTRNFRIIFAACDECVVHRFREKGYNECAGCEKVTAEKTVVFFAFGPHKKVYGE